MDKSLEFSDFHKIGGEPHTSKWRKITKHKFIIFFILSIIILIILIIVYADKNKKSNDKDEIFSKKENELKQLKLNISNNLDDKNNINKDLNFFEECLNQAEIYKEKNQTFLNSLNEEKDNLSSLKSILMEILDKVYTIEEKKEGLNNRKINSSKVYKDLNKFESLTLKKVKNKCYDSIVYDFSPKMFHENCDGSPILILIKAKNDERIGAYTSISSEGYQNNKDDESMIINFDNDNYFKYSQEATNKFPIYCNPDNFTRFGDDLIIYNDGKVESNFPNCYGINEGKQEDFIKEKKFEIDILEVYKVEE